MIRWLGIACIPVVFVAAVILSLTEDPGTRLWCGAVIRIFAAGMVILVTTDILTGPQPPLGKAVPALRWGVAGAFGAPIVAILASLPDGADPSAAGNLVPAQMALASFAITFSLAGVAARRNVRALTPADAVPVDA